MTGDDIRAFVTRDWAAIEEEKTRFWVERGRQLTAAQALVAAEALAAAEALRLHARRGRCRPSSAAPSDRPDEAAGETVYLPFAQQPFRNMMHSRRHAPGGVKRSAAATKSGTPRAARHAR
jgi:hypothetical protein